MSTQSNPFTAFKFDASCASIAQARLFALEAENLALKQKLEDGTALTACPSCGFDSASSSERRANAKIAHLEELVKELSGRLQLANVAVAELWLYPQENFPTGNLAQDIRLFSGHMKEFTEQVQLKMVTLSAALAKVLPAPKEPDAQVVTKILGACWDSEPVPVQFR